MPGRQLPVVVVVADPQPVTAGRVAARASSSATPSTPAAEVQRSGGAERAGSASPRRRSRPPRGSGRDRRRRSRACALGAVSPRAGERVAQTPRVAMRSNGSTRVNPIAASRASAPGRSAATASRIEYSWTESAGTRRSLVRRGRALLLEPARELGPGVHAELAVDAGQVGLDGLGAEVELGRDVLVGGAGGDEVGDRALLGRELLGRVEGPAAQALAGRAELALGGLDPGAAPIARKPSAAARSCSRASMRAPSRRSRWPKQSRVRAASNGAVAVSWRRSASAKRAGDRRRAGRRSGPRPRRPRRARSPPPGAPARPSRPRAASCCSARTMASSRSASHCRTPAAGGRSAPRARRRPRAARAPRRAARPRARRAPRGARVLLDHGEAVAVGDLVGHRGVGRDLGAAPRASTIASTARL